MTLQDLLQKMWIDYCNLNPAAKKIHDLFTEQGETVLNDHIALRTYNHPKLGLESLAKQFKAWGYIEKGDYHFTEKKLYAKHYEHSNTELPKIFISELLLEKCSPFVQKTVNELVEQIPSDLTQRQDYAIAGRPWKVSYKTYSDLAKESEYAAWMSAYGFRPNHFTVFINPLKKFNDITTLNQFIEKQGFILNSSGGKIKGSPSVYLEQSSTMASEIAVEFTDGKHHIPGCYYEFAKRYNDQTGKLYQGFVEKSADKIFESTNKLK